jgi:DNA primase
MAKISPVASKYIVLSTISIEGIVDRPDVIGAIFGQTEGLLGDDLELRELQRSGRIGRIEVNLSSSNGKTKGEIIIPSSLDKTETAIVAAALEIIQRIGPCNAKIIVNKIEDVRTSKRQFVVQRAKELLKMMTSTTLPDSQEISDEVARSVRVMEAIELGPERLASGPAVPESDDIIIVEGRADVLCLLKAGFKNAVAMNGTSCPETIKELSKTKTTTVFVDGDRGGDLIIRELLSVTDLDFVCKAPDGKEVEELTKKELHKGLRGKITAEQARLDLGVQNDGTLKEQPKQRFQRRDTRQQPRRDSRSFQQRSPPSRQTQARELSAEEKKKLKQTMEDLFGTRGACIFDPKLSVLGKVPLSELGSTIKSLNGGIYAIALDGEVDIELVKTSERLDIKHIVATSSKVKSGRVNVITDDQL